jgi:hypothetical protein
MKFALPRQRVIYTFVRTESIKRFQLKQRVLYQFILRLEVK